jgi:hypothetical protein
MIRGCMSLPTLHRLITALVREGLATGVRDGRKLIVKTPGCTVRVLFNGENPAWPYPTELRGGVRLGRRVLQDPVEYLSFCRLDWPFERIAALSDRLTNCVQHAALSEVFRRPPPRFEDGPLAWEGAQFQGDPLHPLHRARTGVSLAHAYLWAPEVGGFSDLCFLRGPTETEGDFDALLEGWLPRPGMLPVHPGQAIVIGHDPGEIERPLPVEAMRWAGAEVRVEHHSHHHHPEGPTGDFSPERRRAWSQASMNSVAPDGLDYHLALTLDARCPDRAPQGDPVGVVERSKRMADALGDAIVQELASARVESLSCIVRAIPRGKVIPAASLVEPDAQGRPLLLALPGADRPIAWFERYAAVLCETLLPPLQQGISLAMEPRDLLLRYEGDALIGVSARNLACITDQVDDLFGTLVPHLSAVARALRDQAPELDLLAVVEPLLRHHLDSETAERWLAPRARLRCLVRSELDRKPVYRDGFNPLRPPA